MEPLVNLKDDTKAIILKEQDITQERLNDDVAKIKIWIEKQSHLPQNIDSALLSCFVLRCNGIENCKVTLDRYFSVRNFVDLYNDRNPLSFHQPDAVQQFFLPGYTKDGRLIYVCRVPSGADSKDFHHPSVVKRQLFLSDYMLYSGSLCSGIIAIYDLAGATASFMANFSLTTFMKATKAYQDNYPFKMKACLMINCQPYFVKTYEAVIKPIMKKKQSSRLVFLKTGEIERLKEYVPDTILPTDLGGCGPTCQELHDNNHAMLVKHKDWLISLQDQTTDETKRSVNIKFDFEDRFGLEGNFRTLTVD